MDINATKYGLSLWWSQMYPDQKLIFEEVPSGEIRENGVNLDNSQKEKTIFDENMVVVDAESGKRMGSRSTVESLSMLGIYFPKQLVEFADNPKYNFLLTNPNYGYLYANFYLKDKALFEFAERGLLTKKMSRKIRKEFGLQSAVVKQREIYNNCEEFFNQNGCVYSCDGNIKSAILNKNIEGGSAYSFYKK